jgi:hypothetical protein
MSESPIAARAYAESDAQAWDELVVEAPMATFLHSRRFLSHHRDRFADASCLILDEGANLVGVLPAATDPTDASCVVSHPGLTYGGLVHKGGLHGERAIAALEALCSHYRRLGFETLRYKAVPYIYHRAPCSDDIYALFRCDAVRYRSNLSCTIDLANRRDPSSRRKRALKKAQKHGVDVREGPECASALWPVLEQNLASRYGAAPVHSLAEIEHLHGLFPDNLAFVVASQEGDVTAGVVLFKSDAVVHAQYIAAGDRARDTGALDAVFEYAIARAAQSGVRYFDFGTSNEDGGRRLQVGLYQFKAEFGGGGVSHDFFALSLS